MNLNRRLFLAGSALGGAALAGCGKAAPGVAEKPKVTVGLTYIPNVQFSPFYLAESEGLFRDQGVDVQLRHHGTQEGLFTALEAGEEQVVFASGDEAVVAAAGGLSTLRTCATCYQSYPGVVLGGPQVAALADLKGRRFGVPGRNGSTWFTALAALAAAGLSESDVEIVEVGWTQVSALTSGQVDAVVGFKNNDAVQVAAAGFTANEIPVVDAATPNLVGPGLMVLDGKVDAATLGRIVAAVKAAEEAIVANPEKALAATEKHVPTLAEPEQRATASTVLEATSALWKRDGKVSLEADEAAFNRMAGFLAERGIIQSAPQELLVKLN